MTTSPSDREDSNGLSPEAAFSLLGNDTRVGILQALWAAFESGTGDNAVPFSDLYDRVDIRDTGNFSYHLEKLSGPFVRQTEGGYELKQTGINVVRAVVSGTVTEDPAFGPTAIDVACPRCGADVEVAYADELLTVACPSCPGVRRWRGDSGFLVGGLVPPAGLAGRPIEEAFHAGVGYVTSHVATLARGTCPHCAGPPEIRFDVCSEHRPDESGLCPACGWAHAAEVWLVCRTCKRSVFPPVSVVALDDPRVRTFYGEHGVDHRFASWETVCRAIEVDEAVRSTEPFEMSCTIRAGDEELWLTVDDKLNVIDAS